MDNGSIRVALANNCTMGTNPANCEGGSARDNSAYAQLLREHAMVYPTGESRVGYSSATLDWITDELDKNTSTDNNGDADAAVDAAAAAANPNNANTVSDNGSETGSLRFLWGTKRMDHGVQKKEQLAGTASGAEAQLEAEQLLMFSLPHHREALSKAELTPGGTPTLHGFANLIAGDTWVMEMQLPPVSFGVTNPIRPEMRSAISDALDFDIGYELPDNYKRGAGDTYFSGKMLAKMARIALIAEELGRHDDAMAVAAKLTEGCAVWLNGTATAKMLYDFRWGGVVSCGCMYNSETGQCDNDVSSGGCPALNDVGQNFGAGFYNDLHL
jgi:endoglucanase Acf2